MPSRFAHWASDTLHGRARVPCQQNLNSTKPHNVIHLPPLHSTNKSMNGLEDLEVCALSKRDAHVWTLSGIKAGQRTKSCFVPSSYHWAPHALPLVQDEWRVLGALFPPKGTLIAMEGPSTLGGNLGGTATRCAPCMPA